MSQSSGVTGLRPRSPSLNPAICVIPDLCAVGTSCFTPDMSPGTKEHGDKLGTGVQPGVHRLACVPTVGQVPPALQGLCWGNGGRRAVGGLFVECSVLALCGLGV